MEYDVDVGDSGFCRSWRWQHAQLLAGSRGLNRAAVLGHDRRLAVLVVLVVKVVKSTTSTVEPTGFFAADFFAADFFAADFFAADFFAADFFAADFFAAGFFTTGGCSSAAAPAGALFLRGVDFRARLETGASASRRLEDLSSTWATALPTESRPAGCRSSTRARRASTSPSRATPRTASSRSTSVRHTPNNRSPLSRVRAVRSSAAFCARSAAESAFAVARCAAAPSNSGPCAASDRLAAVARSRAAPVTPLANCTYPLNTSTTMPPIYSAAALASRPVATVKECRSALEQLVELLDSADDHVRSHAEDRSLSCFIPDLDTTFTARLHDGTIKDLTTEPAPRAQIRVTVSSDDLIDLVEGRLHFASAFAHGQVRIDASLRDLFRLRTLL